MKFYVDLNKYENDVIQVVSKSFFSLYMINLHINCAQEWNAVISLYQHTMLYKLLIRK